VSKLAVGSGLDLVAGAPSVGAPGPPAVELAGGPRRAPVAPPGRPPLLTRLADAVYWFGRYLERAEVVARAVAVHGETHLDLPVGADVGWVPLLTMTGTEAAFADRHSLLMSGLGSGVPTPTEDDVVAFVLCDMDNPSSVLASLSAARTNARAARAVLPDGAWTEVNELWCQAHGGRDGVRGRDERAAWLQAVCATCSRIVASLRQSMAHDDAAAFLAAGQHLERADLTVRILLARADAVVAGLAASPYADVHRRAVLRMLAAADAYRRVVSWDPGQAAVLRFLLANDQFPGSVRSCLGVVDTAAARWSADEVREACTRAALAVGEAANASGSDPGQVRQLLESVNRALGQVHDVLAATVLTAPAQPVGRGGAEVPADAVPSLGMATGRRHRSQAGSSGAAGRRSPQAGKSARTAVELPVPPGLAELASPARRYRVVHRTSYRYEDVATHSYDEAHLQPRQTEQQQVLSSTLSVVPAPVMQASYEDSYGNVVWTFVVEGEFRYLEVTAVSEVEVLARPTPRRTPPWETAVRLLEVGRDGGTHEARRCRSGSRLAPASPELVAYAAPSFTPQRPLLAAVLDLADRIHRDFVYEPGTTTVTTPVLEVLHDRRGVCQDFAHLAIGCLRSMGLAARYVSGYIETSPPPGQERLVGVDASHAWVAVYVPGWGWLDVDPTNDQLVSLSHITVAWGRDYADVAPLRGTVAGGGAHELAVAVDVTRLPPAG